MLFMRTERVILASPRPADVCVLALSLAQSDMPRPEPDLR